MPFLGCARRRCRNGPRHALAGKSQNGTESAGRTHPLCIPAGANQPHATRLLHASQATAPRIPSRNRAIPAHRVTVEKINRQRRQAHVPFVPPRIRQQFAHKRAQLSRHAARNLEHHLRQALDHAIAPRVLPAFLVLRQQIKTRVSHGLRPGRIWIPPRHRTRPILEKRSQERCILPSKPADLPPNHVGETAPCLASSGQKSSPQSWTRLQPGRIAFPATRRI